MSNPIPGNIGRPTVNALKALNITSLEDLSRFSKDDLAAIHGVGPKAVSILEQSMAENNMCFLSPSSVKPKKTEIIDGYTIKYHVNGLTKWSKGKMVDGQPDGYWEWYRLDGTIKRSGHFEMGKAVGEWTTYDSEGKVYKVTTK